MTIAKWASGPWALHLDWKTELDIPIGNDNEIACFVAGYKDHPRNLANANLIAAAPELYEALSALLGGDDKLRVGIGGNPIYVDAFLAKANAALSKARGEEERSKPALSNV